jgi:hypothetical protein
VTRGGARPQGVSKGWLDSMAAVQQRQNRGTGERGDVPVEEEHGRGFKAYLQIMENTRTFL